MTQSYFSRASIVLLLLALFAFSDNLIYDLGQPSNTDPKFVIHGLFFLAWYILLVIQSNFIRKGNIRAHRAWGLWGMGIGAGVILSTFYVFYAIYEGWAAMDGGVRANRIFTFTFAGMLVWAYLRRTQPALHKRLIFVGTLYVLGPIIGRIAEKLGGESMLSFFLFEAIIWNGFFISLIRYDWLVLKKIHPVTWLGLLWFYVVWVYSWLV